MNTIKFLFVALIATLAFVSCSEDQPAIMLWEVTASPIENVKASFDPSFYHQIQISSDGEGGEVTLKCTNYKSLTLIGVKNDKGEYEDKDCNFTARVTEPGIVHIILFKMPEGFKDTQTLLQIDGKEGKDSYTTLVDIIRKPNIE